MLYKFFVVITCFCGGKLYSWEMTQEFCIKYLRKNFADNIYYLNKYNTDLDKFKIKTFPCICLVY